MPIKPTKEFYQAMFDGYLNDYLKPHSFMVELKEFFSEILGMEDDVIENVAVFNSVKFEFDEKKGKIHTTFYFGSKPLYELDYDFGKAELGTVTLHLDYGFMRLTIGDD